MTRKLGKIEVETQRLKTYRKRSKKCRLDRKQKLDALDEITKKKVTRKGTAGPDRLQKIDSTKLIETII